MPPPITICPLVLASSWGLFPTSKLGEATDEVTAILRDAKDLAGAAVKKPVQLSLVGNGNSKRDAG